MERKQLLERLECMKKELARKQRKLKKANRAAKVKAHVKQKIQELNLQARNEQESTRAASLNQNATVSAGQIVSQGKHSAPCEQKHIETCLGEACERLSSLSCHADNKASLHTNSMSRSPMAPNSEGVLCSSSNPNSLRNKEEPVHESKESLQPLNNHDRDQGCGSVRVSNNVGRDQVCGFDRESDNAGKDQVCGYDRESDNAGKDQGCDSDRESDNAVKDQGCGFDTESDNVNRDQSCDYDRESGNVDRDQGFDMYKKSSNLGRDQDCGTVRESDAACEPTFGKCGPALSDTDDSLAITPSFKSMKSTPGFPESYIHNNAPAWENLTGIDSYANTFTLNLHSDETNYDSVPLLSDDPNKLSTDKGWGFPVDTVLVPSNSSERASNKTVNGHQPEVSSHAAPSTCLTLTGTQADTDLVQLSCEPEKIAVRIKPGSAATSCEPEKIAPGIKPGSTATSCEPEKISPGIKPGSAATSVPQKDRDQGGETVLVHDSSSEGDVIVSQNSLSPLPTEKTVSVRDDFLDYTELDAIPFSQFELTEDFLSEPCQDSNGNSQSRVKNRGVKALVQRKSPRLSSFDFHSSDSSMSDRQHGHHGGGPTALYRMVRKQKKSKKALLLSSLFQYLIDEAKRDTSCLEFQLPADLAQLTVSSGKGAGTDSVNVDSPQHTDVEHCDLNTQVIPETEIIPDFASQENFSVTHPDTDNSQPSDVHSQSDCCLSETETKTTAHNTNTNNTPDDVVTQVSNVPDPLSHVPGYSVVDTDKQNQRDSISFSDQINISKSKHDTVDSAIGGQHSFQRNAETGEHDGANNQDALDRHHKPVKQGSCQDHGELHKQCGPVFTPSKRQDKAERAETAASPEDTGRCWVQLTGCAESGCTDAVVELIAGRETGGEHTAFIMSVQKTALTLWSLGPQQQWAPELHWYFTETLRAEGGCELYTTDSQLAVLVWGFDPLLPRLHLLVFVYHWATQHTQRFSLPLPSPVLPNRVFCHGVPSREDCAVVFTSDKSFTRGRRYCLDRGRGDVNSQQPMEAVSARLMDLRLVDSLPHAAVGLTDSHSFLVWNHDSGALLTTVHLSDNLPTLSRMFTCHSLQGYLLCHMSASDSGELCLVAVNPLTGAGKLVTTADSHKGQHSQWVMASKLQDLLVTVSAGGQVSVWDSCLSQLLTIHNTPSSTTNTPSSTTNTPSSISTAILFSARRSTLLVTGQSNGCLHVYSVHS